MPGIPVPGRCTVTLVEALVVDQIPGRVENEIASFLMVAISANVALEIEFMIRQSAAI